MLPRLRHLALLPILVVLTVVSMVAGWAYWSAGSGPGGSGAAAATTLNQANAPSGSVSGSSVTLAWTSTTLASGVAADGYIVRRYAAGTLVEQTVGAGCSGTRTGTSCTETGVPDGLWVYSVTPTKGTSWRGTESVKSSSVRVDTLAPSSSIALSSITGGAYRSGTTIWYRGAAAGSFRLTNTVTDAGSGPASSQTSALSGTTTGWTHLASTVSTPAGGPYVSNEFSWLAGATASPTEAVTTRDVSGNSTSTTFQIANDATAPGGGSISYPNGSAGGPQVSVGFSAGTDSESGVGTRLLQRATATRTGTTCGTFGSFTTLSGGTNPTSPYVDTLVAGTCYKYQYVVADNVGNQYTISSANVTFAPAGAHWRFDAGSGTTAVDSTGNGHTATLEGGAGWTTGKVGASALTVDGTSPSRVSTPGPVVDTSQSYSVAGWVKFNTLAGHQTIASIEGTTASAFYLKKDTNNYFTFAMPPADATGGGAGSWMTPHGTAATTGVWYHVVGVYNHSAGSAALYVNGALQMTSTGAVGWKATGATTIGRARYDDGVADLLNGTIDEVRFFDRALTQSEVNDLALGDTTGPTGGSVDGDALSGTGTRYSTSTTLSIVMSKGTDITGVASTGAQLWRATATLSNGTCGAYGSYTLVATDPASPTAQTVADQACYRYQYVVQDTLGNSTTYTSPDIKVDATAPSTPALSFGTFTNTYWSGSGSTVYYRSAASSGSFRATATASDAGSGIAGYTFPALGTNWTSTAGSPGVNTYSWSAVPAAPGTRSVTATSNAGAVSGASAFTLTADDTAPTAGTVSYFNGSTTKTSISVSFTTGTDSGSGVGTRLLQRASAPLTGGTCGAFGSFTTVTNGTNPTSPLANSVSAGNCYQYQYVVADNVGNAATPASSSSVVKVTTYSAMIDSTAGLSSFWRLGETTVTHDSFSGTSGTTLASRSGEIGAGWTRHRGAGDFAEINNGRLLKSGTGTSRAVYYSSGVPSSANYTVEAEVYVASSVTGDMAGVVGRLDPAADTFYLAHYRQAEQKWMLFAVVNGAWTWLGESPVQSLTVGSTYRVSLDMNGSTIRLLVDGVERVSATNSAIAATGRGGVALGLGGATTITSTTGMHLDEFRVMPRIVDAKGTRSGVYLAGPTLGASGAIPGDASAAVQFDGGNDGAMVSTAVLDDFSVEFWFKSTQGRGTGSQWWQGAALVDNDLNYQANDWGISLRSDGRLVAGVGNADTSIVTTNGNYHNGAWHHVVFTRAAAGAMILYVDGVQAASGTGPTAQRNTGLGIAFGRSANSAANAYAGSLDEVALYGVVLGAATVSEHYNATL